MKVCWFEERAWQMSIYPNILEIGPSWSWEDAWKQLRKYSYYDITLFLVSTVWGFQRSLKLRMLLSLSACRFIEISLSSTGHNFLFLGNSFFLFFYRCFDIVFFFKIPIVQGSKIVHKGAGLLLFASNFVSAISKGIALVCHIDSQKPVLST